jgi:hypothetical protein
MGHPQHKFKTIQGLAHPLGSGVSTALNVAE